MTATNIKTKTNTLDDINKVVDIASQALFIAAIVLCAVPITICVLTNVFPQTEITPIIYKLSIISLTLPLPPALYLLFSDWAKNKAVKENNIKASTLFTFLGFLAAVMFLICIGKYVYVILRVFIGHIALLMLSIK